MAKTKTKSKWEIFYGEVVSVWETLPKEVKVASYLAVSYGIAEVVSILSATEINSPLLAVGVNILLVFLKELRPRISRMKNNPTL